jgi:hypothetical protein
MTCLGATCLVVFVRAKEVQLHMHQRAYVGGIVLIPVRLMCGYSGKAGARIHYLAAQVIKVHQTYMRA